MGTSEYRVQQDGMAHLRFRAPFKLAVSRGSDASVTSYISSLLIECAR